MKFILCMMLMLISAKECDNNKTQASKDTASEMTTELSERRLQLDSLKVTYQAATRGFFMRIWIEGDSIMVSSDNTLKTFETYPFPKEEKERFIALLNDIDETSLPDLKAPSKTFQYDAAQMAWLEISKGENIYKTAIFDHGKPPKAITGIVENILSLKSIVEKQ